MNTNIDNLDYITTLFKQPVFFTNLTMDDDLKKALSEINKALIDADKAKVEALNASKEAVEKLNECKQNKPDCIEALKRATTAKNNSIIARDIAEKADIEALKAVGKAVEAYIKAEHLEDRLVALIERVNKNHDHITRAESILESILTRNELADAKLNSYKTQLESLGIEIPKLKDNVNNLLLRVYELENRSDVVVFDNMQGIRQKVFKFDTPSSQNGTYIIDIGVNTSKLINFDVIVQAPDHLGRDTAFKQGDPRLGYSYSIEAFEKRVYVKLHDAFNITNKKAICVITYSDKIVF